MCYISLFKKIQEVGVLPIKIWALFLGFQISCSGWGYVEYQQCQTLKFTLYREDTPLWYQIVDASHAITVNSFFEKHELLGTKNH